MHLWLAVGLGLVLSVGASGAPLDEFARCLSRARVTYYWAAYCPHCDRQQAVFGPSMRYLRSVDCTAGCDGISAYPTWRFADGSRITGFTPPEVLASRTRCTLDAPARPPRGDPRGDDATGDGTRTHYLGGAKLIEVPRH